MNRKFDDDEVFEPEQNFTHILQFSMIFLKKKLLNTLTKTV